MAINSVNSINIKHIVSTPSLRVGVQCCTLKSGVTEVG